jgi:hypothetical protein
MSMMMIPLMQEVSTSVLLLVETVVDADTQSMGEAGDEESTHKWLDLHTVILGQREAFQSGERSA